MITIIPKKIINFIFLILHKCYPVSEGGCRYMVKIRGIDIDMCKKKYNDIIIDILKNGYPQYRR